MKNYSISFLKVVSEEDLSDYTSDRSSEFNTEETSETEAIGEIESSREGFVLTCGVISVSLPMGRRFCANCATMSMHIMG